ncbi:metalloprotease [Planctomycetales bacterium]|nr:metalloprotease [Planctomycetales bacterium]
MDLQTIWTVTYNVLLVILGINALIIVHEFGHFAVARMCGVRCDKFYIWFDFWGLKFFKFKWGQTEYGLGLFPLGGYVKMLGQEDNPGELRKEIERAKAAATVSDGGLPSQNDEKNNDVVDIAKLEESVFAPDSYLAKSVPQRLAIIVAGVTMNFLFAIVCATGAYMVGVTETAPSIGNVVPGSPAWEAGLQTGDKIVAINNSPARVFAEIQKSMVAGGGGVKLTVERKGTDFDVTMTPRKKKKDLMPVIGIGPLPSLEFAQPEKNPIDPDVKRRLYEGNNAITNNFDALKKTNLRIEKIEGTPVADYEAYSNILLKKIDQPVHIEFSSTVGKEKTAEREYQTLEIPPAPLQELGVHFKMGAITSVLPGSDAEKKGIKPGDMIVSVDGIQDFDPLKLPQIILHKVNAGQKPVTLVVAQASQMREVTVELAPVWSLPSLGALSMREPTGSTALGLAWNVEPVVAGFSPDAPESTKQIPVGGKVISMTFVNSRALLRSSSFSEQTKDGLSIRSIGNSIHIPYVMEFLLQAAGPERLTDKEKAEGKTEKKLSAQLLVENEKDEIKTFDIPVYASKDWFHTDRGFILQGESTFIQIPMTNIGEAVQLGTRRMVSDSFLIYNTLKGLISGNVSPRALGGPILIVQVAYTIAAGGISAYLMFLCLIGANLAVINILPMPPLDGGHVVFLLYEGIFRRAPNEMVQVILSYAGLFLILLLMVWAVSLDLSCIPRW